MLNRLATIDDLKIDSPVPGKAQRMRRLFLLGAVVVLALVAATAWFLRGHFGLKATVVEVYTVPASNPGDGGGFTAGGYLEVIPPGPVVVSSMVEGRVQSVEVIEGQTIQAGQVLARLDDVLYRQQVKVQEATVALDRAKLARQEAGFRVEEIDQAKADLERAQARLTKAHLDYDRHAKLAEVQAIAEKVLQASVQELAAAKADVSGRQAELDLRTRGYRKEDIAIARAELVAAQAELERTRWKLDACVITAPTSGVILERFVQRGDWLSLTVSPSIQRERPSAIVSLVDPKQIQAWVDVNQRDSGRVFVGQEAFLATDAQPGRVVMGHVSRILPKANLQKNTVRVNVAIPDVPSDFRPEMSVKVTFVSGEEGSHRSPGIAVPSSAVLHEGLRSVVYLYAEGRVRVRAVEVAGESGGRVMVQSGIAPGDHVIVNPEGLSEGQAIQLKR